MGKNILLDSTTDPLPSPLRRRIIDIRNYEPPLESENKKVAHEFPISGSNENRNVTSKVLD